MAAHSYRGPTIGRLNRTVRATIVTRVIITVQFTRAYVRVGPTHDGAGALGPEEGPRAGLLTSLSLTLSLHADRNSPTSLAAETFTVDPFTCVIAERSTVLGAARADIPPHTLVVRSPCLSRAVFVCRDRYRGVFRRG